MVTTGGKSLFSLQVASELGRGCSTTDCLSLSLDQGFGGLEDTRDNVIQSRTSDALVGAGVMAAKAMTEEGGDTFGHSQSAMVQGDLRMGKHLISGLSQAINCLVRKSYLRRKTLHFLGFELRWVMGKATHGTRAGGHNALRVRT